MNATPSLLRRRAVVARALALSLALGGALLVALPAVAHAQLRATRAVSMDGAQRAIAAAAAEARAKGWAVSISVVDPSGELVAFLRLDGAPYSSIDVSRGKARTAARFRRPTKGLDSALTAGRYAILAFDAMPVEGGVPIVVDGEIVGAVGVSGVTSAQDAQVAAAGAAAVVAGSAAKP